MFSHSLKTCSISLTVVTVAHWADSVVFPGQGDRRVFTVRIRELHAPAAAAGWREEHYPWSQELSHQAAVWQHPSCQTSGSRRPTCQSIRCYCPRPTFPPEITLNPPHKPLLPPWKLNAPMEPREDLGERYPKLNWPTERPGWAGMQTDAYLGFSKLSGADTKPGTRTDSHLRASPSHSGSSLKPGKAWMKLPTQRLFAHLSASVHGLSRCQWGSVCSVEETITPTLLFLAPLKLPHPFWLPWAIQVRNDVAPLPPSLHRGLVLPQVRSLDHIVIHVYLHSTSPFCLFFLCCPLHVSWFQLSLPLCLCPPVSKPRSQLRDDRVSNLPVA